MLGDPLKIIRFLCAIALAGLVSGMSLTAVAQTNRSVSAAGGVAPPTPLPDSIDFVGLSLEDIFGQEIAKIESINFGMRRVGDEFIPPQLSVDTNLTVNLRNAASIRAIVTQVVNGYENRIRGFTGDTLTYNFRWLAKKTFPDGRVWSVLNQSEDFVLDHSSGRPRIPADVISRLTRVDTTAVTHILRKIPGIRRVSFYKAKDYWPGFERDLRYDSSYVPQIIEVREGGYIRIPTSSDLVARLNDKDTNSFITLWGEPRQPKRYSIATGRSVQIIPPSPKLFPYTDESGTERMLLWVRAEPESTVRIRTSPNLIRWEDEYEVTINPGGDYELDEQNRGSDLFFLIEFAQ
jgi:hypothetical protein